MASKSVVVIGLGNIGLRTLWRLSKLGYNPIGIDSSKYAVKKAKDLGLDALLGDAFAFKNTKGANQIIPELILTSLPGSIGYKVVSTLVEQGYNVVDVSFFPEDPRPLDEIARKSGSLITIDTGIAPGLSNLLVGVARRIIDADRAYIYVGGISKVPVPPLGLAATWSTYDLLEEYIRPARFIVEGKQLSTDPLEPERKILDFPGIGRLEAFPTDGLRTLLYSYPEMNEMIEYTLRRPGHLDFMTGLKSLGLLSDTPLNVKGCSVTPRECLAKVIEKNVSGLEDLVVMKVEAEGSKGQVSYTIIVEPEGNWSAMSIATSAFQVSVTRYFIEYEYNGSSGLIFPEKLGERETSADTIISYVNEEGVRIQEEII